MHRRWSRSHGCSCQKDKGSSSNSTLPQCWQPWSTLLRQDCIATHSFSFSSFSALMTPKKYLHSKNATHDILAICMHEGNNQRCHLPEWCAITACQAYASPSRGTHTKSQPELLKVHVCFLSPCECRVDLTCRAVVTISGEMFVQDHSARESFQAFFLLKRLTYYSSCQIRRATCWLTSASMRRKETGSCP